MSESSVQWRDLATLARLEAAAGLSSPKLWVARHWIPAGVLCVVVVKVLLERGVPENYGQVQAAAAQAATVLAFVYWGLANFAAPILVYAALDRSRRSGMLETLRTTPLAPGEILVALLAGKLWVALHVLLAAAPLFVLLWKFEGAGILGAALLPIAGDCVMSMSFATVLFAGGKGVSGFGGWLLVYFLFPPATFPLKVWFPALAAYTAFHAFWPGAWLYHNFDAFVTAAAIPRSLFGHIMEGHAPAAGIAGATVGWVVYTALFARTAIRAFRVERRHEPSRMRERPAAGKAWRMPKVPPRTAAPGERRTAFPLSRFVVEEQSFLARSVYRLTRRNPFVYLDFISNRKRGESWSGSSSHWNLVGSLMGVCALFMAVMSLSPPRSFMPHFLVVVGTFSACYHAAGVLRARVSEAEALLSSPLRERDVLLGAVGLGFLKAHVVLWLLGFARIVTEGPWAALAQMLSAAGALLLASAFGACSLVSGNRGLERTFVAFGAFLASYLWLRHALGADRGPWNEAMLGVALASIAIWLLLALHAGKTLVRMRS